MYIAIDEKSGVRISANQAVKEGNQFFCPLCKENVLLKKGEIKRPHFAHISFSHCDSFYNASNVMSKWHCNWQEEFHESYREVPIVDEKSNEKHIADVLINGYVIEFQHSGITSDCFMERTKFYARNCQKLIWVFDFTEECLNGRILQYENDKWQWTRPKKTFTKFNPQFPYWKDNVWFMFQDGDGLLRRIVWCIHRYDKTKEMYINSYTRFVTKGCWNQSDFVRAIKLSKI